MESSKCIREVGMTCIRYKDASGGAIYKIIMFNGTVLRTQSESNNGPTRIESNGMRWWSGWISEGGGFIFALATQNVEDIT